MRSGSGAPPAGHTTWPWSRRPRHLAHGQLTRRACTEKVLTWPSSQVTVTPRSRSMSTWRGVMASGAVVTSRPSHMTGRAPLPGIVGHVATSGPDLDAARSLVVERNLVAVAFEHLTVDAFMTLPFEALGPTKAALKRFFSAG